MATVSLKKTNKESTLVVARVSQEVFTILKMNNVNVSKTIREYLAIIASDLKGGRIRKSKFV